MRHERTAPVVHIVDDDASVLAAMSRLLQASGFAVRTFGSAADFLATRDEDDGPGCVLADVQMPGMSGLELQRRWRSRAIRCRSCSSPATATSRRASAPCAMGPRISWRSARRKHSSSMPCSMPWPATHGNASRAPGSVRYARALTTLTKRELEVLSHVVRGQLNKQIAGDLEIHERTVKLHRTAITTKLRVQSVAELTRLTDEAGLFRPSTPTFP